MANLRTYFILFPFFSFNANKYGETYRYDANGNITQLTRKDQNGLTIDNLTYRYNFDANNRLSNNRLRGVADVTPNGTANYDIDNQTATDNYSYDNIGNLTKDEQEGIDKVDWTVYGKVRQVTKSNGNWLQYRYDATGNRISKTEGTVGNRPLRTQYYSRDASGNVMAIYEQKSPLTPEGGVVTLLEQPIYGSSRLGTYNGQTARGTQTLGNKNYEISNHLGNVLLTFTDNKYQDLKINSATDYYPFGMTMKGREFQAGKYRYGFNTQEKDNSINPNHYTAMYWEYDGRIGRRWNLDPVPQVNISDYVVNRNNPISYMDWLGDDAKGHDIKIIGGKVKSISYDGIDDGKIRVNGKLIIERDLSKTEKASYDGNIYHPTVIAKGATMTDILDYTVAMIKTYFPGKFTDTKFVIGTANEKSLSYEVINNDVNIISRYEKKGGFFLGITPRGIPYNKVFSINNQEGQLHLAYENPYDLLGALDHEQGHEKDSQINYNNRIYTFPVKTRQINQFAGGGFRSVPVKIGNTNYQYGTRYSWVVSEWVRYHSEIYAGMHEMMGNFWNNTTPRYKNFAMDYFNLNIKSLIDCENLLIKYAK